MRPHFGLSPQFIARQKAAIRRVQSYEIPHCRWTNEVAVGAYSALVLSD